MSGLPAPGSAGAWLLACRPATLTAALAPVAVGTACAARAGGWRPGAAVAALAGAVLLQVGTNLANDVGDAERGADTAERLGPPRAVSSGLLTARQAWAGAAAAFALATVCGVYLTAVAGPAVVAIGTAAIAAGVLYTAGPWPLGYHGLGELFVVLFFGLAAVCGTAYVQVGSVPAAAWWAAAAPGALAAAVLVVNNLRDRETDVRAGKRTLAVRWGRRAGLVEYGVLLAVGYAAPAVLAASGQAGAAALAPWVTAPAAVALARRLGAAADGPTHNAILRATARLVGAHGLLFAAGLAVG